MPTSFSGSSVLLRTTPARENDYRINVKAELEIELLHEKIDQLREREVLRLTEAVRTLTELLGHSASDARQPDAEGGRPS